MGKKVNIGFYKTNKILNASAINKDNFKATPGLNGAFEICLTNLSPMPFNLFSKLTPNGQPIDTNGSWSDISGLGVSISGGYLGTLNEVEIQAANPTPGNYIYRYTVNGTGLCSGEVATSEVVLSIIPAPNAGANGTHTICV